MCGLAGFIGVTKNEALLTEALKGAARRGPHGYGAAYVVQGKLAEIKTTVPLKTDLGKITSLDTQQLILNSRLSTYGSYEDLRDFHPHFNKLGDIGIVHNGNVRNMKALVEQYSLPMRSDCDSEVIAHLMSVVKGTPLLRAIRTINLVDKSSPLAVLMIYLGAIIAVRRGHPLYITRNEDSVYLCSRETPDSESLEDNMAYSFTLDRGVIRTTRTTLEDL